MSLFGWLRRDASPSKPACSDVHGTELADDVLLDLTIPEPPLPPGCVRVQYGYIHMGPSIQKTLSCGCTALGHEFKTFDRLGTLTKWIKTYACTMRYE